MQTVADPVTLYEGNFHDHAQSLVEITHTSSLLRASRPPEAPVVEVAAAIVLMLIGDQHQH